jgi:putative MFS transporter
MQLSSLNQGLIAASALIGVFVGGMIFGNLADRHGRCPVFAWNLGAFVILSVLQFFVQEMWQLVVLRLALGLPSAWNMPWVPPFWPNSRVDAAGTSC